MKSRSIIDRMQALARADIQGQKASRTLASFAPKPVVDALDRMKMAGELLEEAKRREPSKAADMDTVFVSLQPSELLKSKADWIYKAHARELIQRAGNRRDLKLATRAEIMCFLYELSLKAPLKQQPAALYVRIFDSLAPKRLRGKIEEFSEPWAGASNELEQELRKKLAQERRAKCGDTLRSIESGSESR